MRVIQKYQLQSFIEAQILYLPKNANILSVHTQYGIPQIFVEGDTMEDILPMTFHTVTSGSIIEDGWKYVASYIIDSMYTEYHVYIDTNQ